MNAFHKKKSFRQAIASGNEKGLNELLSQTGTEIVYSNWEETPLLYAVKLKKPRMVDIILRYTNTIADAENCTRSLDEACNTAFPSIEIIRKLIAHKANVNCKENKITPLMRASFFGNVTVMNLLIEAGAKINALDSMGRTAICFTLLGKGNNSDALNLLLIHNAKLSIPFYPYYNPLPFAIRHQAKNELIEILIPLCKYDENFSEALMASVTTNQMHIFQKLVENGAKLTDLGTECMLRMFFHVISHGFDDFFDLLWRYIHEYNLSPQTFIGLFHYIFHFSVNVSIFESNLKKIINTPGFNCNLTSEEIVIQRMFEPARSLNFDWNLCKDTLLEFFEYINRLGIRLINYDLVIIIEYFKNNCKFIMELLAVFFKYDPGLNLTMFDVINLSCNNLDVTSQLLYNCSNYLPQSIYKSVKLHTCSEDLLIFFLQRFTPTKSDIGCIREFQKFDNINIESLEVPTLKEIARNAWRRKIKNNKLEKVFHNLHIPPPIKDIFKFKTPVNYI